MTSVEFKVNFLAGATPEGGEIVGQARLIRKVKTVAVVQVDVHQGEVHVATGLFTYITVVSIPSCDEGGASHLSLRVI